MKDEVERLIRNLQSRDWVVRNHAAYALGLIGDARAVEPLIKALEDSSSSVRMNAAEALGEIGDARAVEPLIKALGDEDSWVRKDAAKALGKIGDKKAVEPLIKALGDRSSSVRMNAAETLAKLGEPLGEAAVDLGEAVVDVLDGKEGALERLIKMRDSRAVEPLIKALGDSSSEVRENAAYALGELGDKRAVEPLIKALGDSSSYVRYYAAYALDKISAIIAHLIPKLPGLICKECFTRFQLLKAKKSLFSNIVFCVCRYCKSATSYFENIEKVVVVLDKNMKVSYLKKDSILYVNWFNIKKVFDFDEIYIKEADNFEVEELVMKVRNDTDKKRIKKYKKMVVNLMPNNSISQAKINLLDATFKKVEIRDIVVPL
ncbi:MAG: HEAT repeat domain-containing protein [Methanosarcinales archaeon]